MIDQLRIVLDKKRRTIKCDDERLLRDKLIRFALSRGYSMDHIRAVVGYGEF